MKKNHPEVLELTDDMVNDLQKVESLKEDSSDELNLSFSSLEDYEDCPHKYNLIYNYEFVSPQNVYMRICTILPVF